MKLTHAIYIGMDSASVAKMDNGVPCIIKSKTLRDEIPICVFVNKRGGVQAGDSALNAYKREYFNYINGWENSNNSFRGFIRSLGTGKSYYSSNVNKTFSSEELLAEVIKTILTIDKGEVIKSAVIAVPDNFGNDQIQAVKKAGNLAGLQQIEIIQESIAATLFYGLKSKDEDGFYLIFKLESEVFNCSLQKVEKGYPIVIDTEGDDYLGDKNLNEEIVDQIIIPYLKENFEIDKLLLDNNKSNILRTAMKIYAEEIKKQLSFNNEVNILTPLGDIPGEDDEGEEFELDLIVTQNEFSRAVLPIFQKTINSCLRLIDRNNLKGSDLKSLYLIGAPTISPILRQQLEEQICKPDTSVDPKTVVSKGAALYASTVDVSEEVSEQTIGKPKGEIPEIVFSQPNRSEISINQVEDLLFELTENEVLSSSEFKNYFEKLSALKKNNDLDTLAIIQEEFKSYGKKA